MSYKLEVKLNHVLRTCKLTFNNHSRLDFYPPIHTILTQTNTYIGWFLVNALSHA